MSFKAVILSRSRYLTTIQEQYRLTWFNWVWVWVLNTGFK